MGGKVLIGFPCSMGEVPFVFAESLGNLEKPEGSKVRRFGGYSISEMRNVMAKTALDEGYEDLFMVDADQYYPSWTLTKLLSEREALRAAGHEQVILSGLTCSRRRMEVTTLTGETIQRYLIYYFDDGDPNCPDDPYAVTGRNPPYEGVHEVRAMGGAGVLIPTACLEALDYPYFRDGTRRRDGKTVGEDIAFSVEARVAGWRLFVDCDLRFLHEGRMLFFPSVVELPNGANDWSVEAYEYR